MDRYDTCNRQTRGQLNNRGITLVEILITFAIIAVVGGLIVGIVMAATKSYRTNDAEVDMQYDAQLLLNQIETYVLAADEGLEQDGNEYRIYSSDADDLIIRILNWDSAQQTLFFSQVRRKADTSEVEEVAQTPLAENVNAFSMDLSKADKERKVTTTLELIDGQKTYDASVIWSLRNGVLINAENVEDYVEDTPEVSKIEKVIVNSTRKILVPGKSQLFTAEVIGTYYPSQKVTWSIAGNTDSDTVITKNGVLYLGENERGDEANGGAIIVTARSVQDPSIAGSLTIYVHYAGIYIYPEEAWISTNSSSSDPDHNGQNSVQLYYELLGEGLSANNVTWTVLSRSQQGEWTSHHMPDLQNVQKVVVMDSEDPGAYTISASANINGNTFSSNQPVVHRVLIDCDDSDHYLYYKEGAKLTIKGMEDVAEGDFVIANSLKEIKNNSQATKFYLYDTRGVMTYSNLQKDYLTGEWTCDVQLTVDWNLVKWMFQSFRDQSTSICVYEAGTTFPKTHSDGNTFEYGFTVYKMKISWG